LTPASFSSVTITPNPFQTKTKITFANPKACVLTLQVYNSLGQCVKTFNTQGNQIIWDGRGDKGQRLADGVYFLKFNREKGEFRKLIITR